MEIIVTEENFESEVLNSDVPVLLDFFANWCGPCKMLSPIIAEIAAENQGKIKVGKINVDEEEGLAAAFHIASIPTIVAMKNGKVSGSLIGYHAKEEILGLLA